MGYRRRKALRFHRRKNRNKNKIFRRGDKVIIKKLPHVEGLELEERVERILLGMQSQDYITSFIRHPRNSKEDQQGKDFTVTCNGGTESFGVTTSAQRAHRAAECHPSVINLHFPIYCPDEEIMKTILDLFASPAAAT